MKSKVDRQSISGNSPADSKFKNLALPRNQRRTVYKDGCRNTSFRVQALSRILLGF